MDFLQNYNYSCNNISNTSIMFSLEPCNYTYKNINVNSPVTLKLFDFSNSSISILTDDPNSKIRLYQYSSLINTQLNSVSYNPFIITLFIPSLNIYVWKFNEKELNNQGALLYIYTRNIGIAKYQNSLNLYIYLILLMTNKKIYDTVINTKDLYDIWSSLFIADEVNIINARIKTMTSEPNLLSIVSILYDLHLLCDPFNIIWSKFN